MRTEARALAGLLCLAAGACDSSSGAPPAPDPSKLVVVVSIDWEGAYFRPESLEALEQFRRDNPDVPITHMLNAAYYTKPGADAAAATRQIRQAVKKGDDTGLHIHAWKSLLTASGVTPRDGPSFLSRRGELLPFEDDLGFDVDITVLSVSELRAVMRKSREILAREQFAIGPSFRAPAWLGTANVLEAARAEGFTVDSSAVDPAWFDEEEVPFLQERLRALWSKVDQRTEPFWIDTPAGRILELPDTGALADYLTAAEMTDYVRRGADRLRAVPGRPVFVHLGFHAETADEFAPRLGEALVRLRAARTPMVFETISRAAELARRALENPK